MLCLRLALPDRSERGRLCFNPLWVVRTANAGAGRVGRWHQKGLGETRLQAAFVSVQVLGSSVIAVGMGLKIKKILSATICVRRSPTDTPHPADMPSCMARTHNEFAHGSTHHELHFAVRLLCMLR